MSFKNNVEIYQRFVQLHEQFVDEWKDATDDADFITQCIFQSIPTVFAKHGLERGGNVLGLDKETDNIVMLLFDIAVKTPELEALARSKIKLYGEAMRAYAAGKNSAVDWTYLNYADGYQVCVIAN
ncbi:hypothetical protein J1614_011643 [Plenodomus biglobosus]|nr:hypothetical protein J1614_011643 [Plenodomus biglobosus]